MRTRLLLVAHGVALFFAAQSYGATSPVVNGPDAVAPNATATFTLQSGVSGTWTINWGDSTANSVILSGIGSASHTFASRGVYEVSATFRNSAGKSVDVQRDYSALVLKTSPLLYYNFNDPAGSQHVGPTCTFSGSVTSSIESMSGNTGAPGGALRLNSNGCLRIPDLKMDGASFFGLEFWLRPSDLVNRQMIFAGVGSQNGNVRVFLENSRMCFELAGSGTKAMDLGADFQAGRWYHFAVSYERSPNYFVRNKVRFYRDGLLRNEEAFTADLSRGVSFDGAIIGAGDSGGSLSNYLRSASIDEIVLHRLGVFPGPLLERYRAVTDNLGKFKVTVGTAGAAPFTVDPPAIIGDQFVPLDPNPSAAIANRQAMQNAVSNAIPGTRLKIVNKNTAETGGTFYMGVTAQQYYSQSYIIQVKNKTDLEIDGEGAQLLMTTPALKYFEISGCTRVAMRNLRLDVDQTMFRPSVYALVESVDEPNKQFVVRYVKGKDLVDDAVPSGVKPWRWRRVDRETRSQLGGFVFGDSASISRVTTGTTAVVTFSATARSADEWAKLRAVKNDNAMLQINNAHFGGSAVSLWSSQHLTFENIDIYGVTGMAFLSSGFDYLRIADTRIGLPPGLSAYDRPFAAAADGYHFHGAAGGHVIFENNEISMTDDDPISIKDGVVRNVEQTGTNSVAMNVAVGTVLEFRGTNLNDFNFTATVIAKTGTTAVTLDRNLPGTAGTKYHVLNKSFQTANWILRNNRIYDLNGRLMIYTHDGTVENNRLERMYGHIGMSAADFDNAGEPYSLLYRGNYFERGSNDTSVWGAYPTEPVIKDVVFLDNSFYGNRFKVNYTDGFTAVDSYFEKVSAEGSNGLFHFANYSRNARVVDSLLYDPVPNSELFASGTGIVQDSGNLVRKHTANGVQVIVDNVAAAFAGSWSTSAYQTGQFFGSDYRYASTSSATRYATYTPNLPEAGKYQVYAMWNGSSDRGETVRYVVTHADGATTVVRSQRSCPGLWVNLGAFNFVAGTSGSVRVETANSNGIVIADAIRFDK